MKRSTLKRRVKVKTCDACTASMLAHVRRCPICGHDVEAQREGEGQRSSALRRAPLKPRERPIDYAQRQALGRPSRSRAKIPAAVREEAMGRTAGLCAMCLHRVGLVIDPESRPAAVRRHAAKLGVRKATELHHVLPWRMFEEFRKVVWNLVGLCAGCHDEHERAHRRLPRAILPPMPPGIGTAAHIYIERTYPLADAGRFPAEQEGIGR